MAARLISRVTTPVVANTAPFTLDEIKAQLRVVATETDEDDALTLYALSATDAMEQYTGQALRQYTVTDHFETLDELLLWRGPFISAPTVTYADTNGDTKTLAFGVGYYVYTNDAVISIRPPPGTTFPYGTDAQVTYTVGYMPGFIPASLKMACIALVAYLDANRSSTVGEMPKTIAYMAAPYVRRVL